MEHLVNTCSIYARKDGQFDNRVVSKLIKNFRSAEEIIRVPNELFYHGELIAAAKETKMEGLEEEKPLQVIGVQGEEIRDQKGSVCNPEEVTAVIKVISDLRKRNVKANEVAIISPYSAQITKIREALTIIEEGGVFCGTAEKLQAKPLVNIKMYNAR